MSQRMNPGLLIANPAISADGSVVAFTSLRNASFTRAAVVIDNGDLSVDLFAAKLKIGGEFRLATDDPTYLAWSLMVMQRHRHQFEWRAERPRDFLEPSRGWIETRYGAKSRREGRRPYYLRYVRV